MQKRVLEVLKTWYFPYSAFWSAGQWGGGCSPPAPPGYATALMYAIFLDSSKAFDRVCHYILFQKLSQNQVPLNLVRFIMYWYKPGCRTVSNNGSGSGLAPAQNILAVQVWFGFT